MSREVKRVVSSGNVSVAIVHTEGSGGSRFTNPAVLQTVRLATSDLEKLWDAARIGNNSRFETLEKRHVDGRYRGPQSNYGQVLQRMESELPDRLHPGSPADAKSVWENPTVADVPVFRARMLAQTLGEQLKEVAPSRPPRAYGEAAEVQPRTSKHRI